jgi:predicted peroxiredoxin
VRRQLDRRTTIGDVEILYIASCGTSDPTRASIPWHLAVNGSIEAGQTARMVLAGDAFVLPKSDIRDNLEGLGVPPFRDLIAKALDRSVPIHV